jgi:hypothetical protein
MRSLKFLFLLPLLAFVPHKYYVSTTDIYHKPKQQQLQLVVRVFTDDFSRALSAYAKQDISLDPDTQPADIVAQYISNYFKDRFIVHEPTETTSFSFVGWEYKQDQTHLYASFDDIPEMDILAWSNSFLFDVFPDQKNIVTLSTSMVKKSFLHTKDQNYAQFYF